MSDGRRAIAAFVVSLAIVAPVAARQPLRGAWAVVDRQPRGTPIVIELMTLEEVRGAMDASTERDISLVTDNGDRRTFPKTLVREVRTPGAVKDPLSNGMLHGALIGAASMAAIIVAAYAQCDAGCEAPAFATLFFPAVAIGAVGGLGAGAAVDATRRRPLVLYRAAANTTDAHEAARAKP